MKSALFAGALAAGLVALQASPHGQASRPRWALNASVIEACSCTMFCQC